MRQLVSVVKDGHVRYYVAEGDALEEVARIRVGDRFTPEATAMLGLNVAQAIGPITVARAEAPAPALPAAASKRGRKKGVKQGPRQKHPGLTPDAVLAAVRLLPPGCSTADVIDALGVSGNDLERKTVTNRLHRLRELGKVRSESDGPGKKATWFYVAEQEPTDETTDDGEGFEEPQTIAL